MDIRVLPYANNRTETDFSDEPLFWRKSPQLAVYCTFLLEEVGFAPFYRKITKRESKSFSRILGYSLMPIIDPKQIFLMSLYFGENLPNWRSIVHFYWRKLYICTIFSGYHQEGEQIIFMDIRVLLSANNRTKTDVSDVPLFWRNYAQLAVYCTFLFKEIGLCTISSENHKEGEQIIFLNIRVLLYANDRTETDVSDEPIFLRKSSQLAVYRTFPI